MLSIQQILKYIQYYTLVEFHATLKQVKATLLQIVPTNVYSYYEMLSFKPLTEPQSIFTKISDTKLSYFIKRKCKMIMF